MSSGGVKGVAGSGGGRVSIPGSVKKTINNIKEITGQNHSDDEIYAVLKECSMDPNETTQKLLLLDTFREVKRKNKRKENLNEAAESKWKPGIQARANREGRGNYPPRYISHDAGSGRNLVVAKENAAAKENAISPLQDKGTNKAPLASAQEMKKKETSFIASSIAAVPNGPSSITSHGSNIIHDSHADPALLPSQDLPLHSAVGPSQREVRSERAPVKLIADSPTESKLPSAKNLAALEVESSNLPPSLANDLHGIGKNQHLKHLLPESSTSDVSIVSCRPSYHNNRPQVIGPQKVGLGTEWKPKVISSTVDHGVVSTVTSSDPVKSHPELQPTPAVQTQRQDSVELQIKLEDLYISDSEHVIIPNHLHVPEAEKLGFCFGSFDAASFGDLSYNGVPVRNLSQSSEAINEPVEEQQLSQQNDMAAAEDIETKHPSQSQSPIQEPEFFSSSEVEISSTVTPDYGESEKEVAPGTLQHPIAHNYNYGLMPPPTLNSQLTPLESSEFQARDAPRFPGFIVPQSFDPASYYAQFYRSSMDNDGRASLFLSAGAAANKYNVNAGVVSQQPSQSPQEGGVPLVLSTTSPTQIATQPAAVVQNSLPTQQPLPVFQQPTGVHLPHFPPNYIPYGPYFSPYYIQPPAIHQFLSNGAFPQPGNLYPTPTGTNAAKYSVSPYKQGSNMGNSTHIGVPPGPYGLSMANYASNSAAVTSTSNEDPAAPQVKENNIYVSGQRTEGSGVWFTTPGRDISTLPPTSFYNLSQGQLGFNPTQPTLTGIFHHPAQAAAAPVHPLFQQPQAITSSADMAGPAASVYQQQQHAQQMNWPSNY